MLAAGVALAVILSGVRHISDTVFLEAAKVRIMSIFSLHLSSYFFFFLNKKKRTLILAGTCCDSVLKLFAC